MRQPQQTQSNKPTRQVPLPVWTKKQAQVYTKATTEDWWKILINTGAFRSGKTVVDNALFLNDLQRVREMADERNEAMPQYILAGYSSKTITSNILVPLQQAVPGLKIKWDRNGAFELLGVRVVLSYTGTSRGMDSIRGMTAWGAYVNEVSLANEAVWNEIVSRVSVENARIIGDTNPDNPSHWLKTKFIDKADDPESEVKIMVNTFTLDENTFLASDYVNNLKASLTGVWYQRGVLGHWTVAEGTIYANFDKDKMVVDLPANTTFEDEWVSVDYGTLNATVFKRWSLYRGVWYNTAEYYYSGRETRQQRTDAEFAEDMEQFYKDNQLDRNYTRIILDPSAASFRTELKKRGFVVKKAKNDVINGIRAEMTAMNEGLIKWTPNAVNTFREFGLYVWDETASNRGEDKPVKQNDHALDADRYFVYTVLAKDKKASGFITWKE
ncbi:PBSX family phage terminase large subunit [Weissella cibaria]|uniref:PBSX family phage terminase large subunit n=1 Tax=Weissella cibaria TaxID=137591 RepID=UPI0022E8C93B|nr:PBSX family phage terminase large subunit [Weissella cibaria]